MADADELPAGFEFRAFVYGRILRTEGSRQQAAGRRQKAESGRQRLRKSQLVNLGRSCFRGSVFCLLLTAYCSLSFAAWTRQRSGTMAWLHAVYRSEERRVGGECRC